jgi:hypothetical protein
MISNISKRATLYPSGQQQSQAVAQKTYVHRCPSADPSLVSSNAHVSVNRSFKRHSICTEDPGRQGNDGGLMAGYANEIG